MQLDTRAVFTVEILLNIARGSLGGGGSISLRVSIQNHAKTTFFDSPFMVNTLKMIKNLGVGCPKRNSRYR